MRVKFVLLCLTLCCLGTLALAAAPTISDFYNSTGPAVKIGAVGQMVTIHGSNFNNATTVQFYGMTTAVSAQWISNFYVKVAVPLGATTGIIKVITPSGSGDSTSLAPVNYYTVLTPPTIQMANNLTNLIVNMNSPTIPVFFNVNDAVTPAGSLTVTRSIISSIPNLLPALWNTLGGSGAIRVMNVRPGANLYGTATITLTVTDLAGLTATTSFTVNVNGAPTITSIVNLTINMNPTAVPMLQFTVGDDMTLASALTVAYSITYNPALTSGPSGSIVLTHPGANGIWYVAVTPHTNYTGATRIKLTVTDGNGLTATTSFCVIVTPLVWVPWVPGSSFMMGCPSAIDSGVASAGQTQWVQLTGYWLYKYPVTVAQYRDFCALASHTLPPFPIPDPYHGAGVDGYGWMYSWTGYTDWTTSVTPPGAVWSAVAFQKMPIYNVTWYDALAYATWANSPLPTEAQYEYASRGTAENNYPWSGPALPGNNGHDGWDYTKCSNYYNSYSSDKSTWPVGSFPAGASWCGAQDLSGNVCEWCWDWYGDYSTTTSSSSPLTDPTGPTSGSFRVQRGESWYGGIDGRYFRGAYRYSHEPGDWGINRMYGGGGSFRCAVH